MSRILLSAYACEPGKGSEPEVGWLWATELAASGHEVWVITRETNRPAIEMELASRQRPKLHFTYYDLPPWARRWKRGARGVHLYYALWQWEAYRVARQLTREINFDCVHHVTFVGVRGPSFMGRLGLPFILGPVSGGECVPKALRAGMTRPAKWRESVRDVANRAIHADPIMRSSFRRAERILLATPESLQLIPAKFREKCVVQLGIGLSREYLGWTDRKRNPRETPLRLLYVGRLLEWKGLDLGIQAVRLLRGRGVRVRFTIIGEGPARESLQQLATELGVAEDIAWVAWQPHEQLHELYYQHDVLLFPSLRDSGGMVVLEALAHGLPAVCTDRGGPGAIVNDRCGRVVPTSGGTKDGVIVEMADALHKLSCDRTLLKKLGAAARKRAWEFDFHKVVTRLHPMVTVGREAEVVETVLS
ncbi:MAG TPA: glycosyltransferase family 4 protein [Terriglobales bacterium]